MMYPVNDCDNKDYKIRRVVHRKKNVHISDSLPNGSYRTMSFQYGPDRERWYSELADDGVTSRSTFSPYLAFTDHLGSVLAILDEYGLYRFRAEYDVWGKPTVNPNLIGFHRGYTGHEMLPEFDLINMNGRLYDPMIGRFLSPDNYVQEPDNSQNFNRYSYCINNPLKYTDPSGELFGIDDAVFAFAAFNMAASMMHAAAMGGSAGDIWKAGGISLLSSAGTYGIGSAFSALGSAGVMSKTGLELCRAGAHGLNSGIISSLSGGNFGVGFLSGASASGIGSFSQYVHMNPGLMLASTSAMGGISSWATGGGFLSGAINGMYIGAFNHLMHSHNGYTYTTYGPEDGGYAIEITFQRKMSGTAAYMAFLALTIDIANESLTGVNGAQMLSNWTWRHAISDRNKIHMVRSARKNLGQYGIGWRTGNTKTVGKITQGLKETSKWVRYIRNAGTFAGLAGVGFDIYDTGQIGWGHALDLSMILVAEWSTYGTALSITYGVSDIIYANFNNDTHFRDIVNNKYGTISLW